MLIETVSTIEPAFNISNYLVKAEDLPTFTDMKFFLLHSALLLSSVFMLAQENPYSNAIQNNPTGAATGYDRVNRGGSWSNTARLCRTSGRDNASPTYRDNYLGFRVVSFP